MNEKLDGNERERSAINNVHHSAAPRATALIVARQRNLNAVLFAKNGGKNMNLHPVFRRAIKSFCAGLGYW